MPSRKKPLRPAEWPAAVIGMGLMGHSIAACLLAAGHPVTGVTRSAAQHRGTPARIRRLLREMAREGMLRRDPAKLMANFTLTEDYSRLAGCRIVLESIVEDIETKKAIYRAIEDVVPRTAIIGSNTSSIPLTLLQEGARHPDRFVGVHWDEPAHITCFMEIIMGRATAERFARQTLALAALWGKEPSLLRRDVRGFITNRISYAMFREACHLVDSGVCTFEDVDRSLRNDVGWWMPFAGPFRYMDLMGVEAYYRVMKDLLPELNKDPGIPPAIAKVVESGGKGIASGRGFYRYTKAEAEQWEREFLKFNYEIRKLTGKYSTRLKKIK
ncbi:MAG: 3-hydroxyacyl-CoA dehydrogenase family protein [Bryobacteraceae bacterium]|nr:3-hydroxyacyl-CoA dehydrogenase family protein [Bryobacteraceae bacterium]